MTNETEQKKLGLGNYVGIGMCTFAWVGLMPFAFENLGASLKSGIITSAISIGILVPLLIYFSKK